MIYSLITQKSTYSVAYLILLSTFGIFFSSSVQAQLLTQRSPLPRVGSNQEVRSESAYRLGGGDRIRVEILEVPQYSGEYQILPEGAINLPLVGKVSLKGLTLEQASKVISAKYSAVLRYPVVTVNLIDPRPVRVLVSGEVNRPVTYTISIREPASPNLRFPTVNPVLRNNDIILVNRSRTTRFIDTLEDVLRPINNISILLRILRLF